jgi:16S rRNA (guanine(966)-N(2))-methyltransferase RsmD
MVPARRRAGLHVVAGEAKGMPLVAPRGARPTTGRVREALFSALGDVHDHSVLELFAGSGALAIEALSRGAASAVLVECDPAAIDACAANLESTRMADRATVLGSRVDTVLARRPPAAAPFDLVLLDPPYETSVDELQRVLDALRVPGWLAPGARTVVERATRSAPLVLPDGWAVGWERKYGDTLVVVLMSSTWHEQG